MKGLFLRSIEDKEKIIIFYIDIDNQITERCIRVLKMHRDSILAYCYYRKGVRKFKLKTSCLLDELERK